MSSVEMDVRPSAPTFEERLPQQKVVLNSGGPPMFVQWIDGDDVHCTWLGEAGYWHADTFALATLSLMVPLREYLPR